MIYIVPIFLFLMAIYCLQPGEANLITIRLLGNEVLIWQMYFYVVMFSMFSITFYELRRKSVLKSERFVYLCGFIFLILYTLFNLILYLNNSGLTLILSIINLHLWSAVFYTSILVMLISIVIYLRYDRSRP